MSQNRRMGVESSSVRAQFVDATEAILREEGYPAISARHVAARAGLKTQLLYYYFRTMDELLLAVVKKINDRRVKRFEEALASPQPLRAIWAMNIDPSGAAVATQLTSVASHRETIREEIVSAARAFRAMQIAAVTRILAEREGGGRGGATGADYARRAGPAAAGLMMLAVGLARTIVTERTLGLTEGHEEALALVEEALTGLGEPPLS